MAGAARNVVRMLRDPKEVALAAMEGAVVQLESNLERWDAAGNPADLGHADQRLRYLRTLEAFLDASGNIAIGAFANDELAGRAVALRSALSVHMDEIASVWDADRGLED